MSSADLIVEGFFCNKYYPKERIVEPGTFAIFSFEISKIILGKIDNRVKNKYYREGFVTFKGPVPELNKATKYKISASLVEDRKYGWGYEIESMNISLDLTSKESVSNFLSLILPPKTVENLFEAFEDPIPIIKHRDINALCSIKGIGEQTAQKIILKYESTKDNSSAYSVLHDYGLTKNMIDKIVRKYKSPDTAIKKVRENPYVLIDDVDGFGWTKCDQMALNYGIPADSEYRINSYIKYYLKNLADVDGHTWVQLGSLVSNLRALVPGITDERLKKILRTNVDSKSLYYKPETKQIGLYRYRLLEESICEELFRLMKFKQPKEIEFVDETIAECEDTVGFKYTEEQKRAIKSICENNVVLLTANAGCVDSDTEYFNGAEWKKISDYCDGESVLQYNNDGSASLTNPLLYIKKPCDKMYHFETKYGVDQTLCEDHNVVYWASNGQQKSCGVLDIKDKQENGTGFYGKFKASFIYNGSGIDLTDNEIKIMCAVICDGTFYKNMEGSKDAPSYMRCRFHIKKDRKKEALRKLFTESGIWWRESESAKDGYTDFYINAPRREKEFTSYWYNCNQRQLRIICDNIMFWDGNVNVTKNGVERMRFSSNVKSTADFVQFAYSSCGYRARVLTRDRSGNKYLTNGKFYERKSIEYSVVVTDKDFVGINHDHRPSHTMTKIETVKPTDGYKYCFSVESTMLVLRRNGNIFITGNCGKTSLMYPVTRIFKRNGIDFSQCTLSGKASLNLQEITQTEGQTIHKLLRWVPDGGFGTFLFDKNNQLPPRAVILDEVSMVGGNLFRSLVQAMSNGSKLIMIGDPGQLESIGLCNLISDIVTSCKIPHIHLSKIFRQAEKSGIITDSIKVYNQEMIIPRGYIGHQTHGELQDFEIYSKMNKESCLKEILNIYDDIHKNNGASIEDILIVTAKRCAGGLSAAEISEKIQKTLTFDPTKPTVDKEYNDEGKSYTIKYHVGDRVLVTQNDYKTFEEGTGEIKPIFNGNIGTIIKIKPDGSEMVVDFSQGKIVIRRGAFSSLQLGYAITTHKSQGSGFKYVIAIADPGAYTMLTKEFLYTAITRAKRHCYLVGTPESIERCVKTTRVIKKQTWLSGLLSGRDCLECIYDKKINKENENEECEEEEVYE